MENETSLSPDIYLYLVIPLLREQMIIDKLFERLVQNLQLFDKLRLVFVTSEREVLETISYEIPTTSQMLQVLIKRYGEFDNRIIHFHYPCYNRVVADQLNFAIKELLKLPGVDAKSQYVAFYNADTIIDDSTIRELFAAIKRGTLVAQQSSLFLWNVPRLARKKHYYLAAHGLYQSGWTLQHEVPRYLLTHRFSRWIPIWLERISLVHCVTHGLLIRLDLLNSIGDLPDSIMGGEDLALGFVLKGYGYQIEPIQILENSETPDKFVVLWKQLAGWFLGTVGYLFFWRIVPKEVRHKRLVTIWSMSILGCLDSIKWLVKGPLFVFYIYLGLWHGELFLSLLVYFVYVYVPYFSVLWLWNKLPQELFPRTRLMDMLGVSLVFWIVPILRSGPAFLGCWWALQVAGGRPFIKQKTER